MVEKKKFSRVTNRVELQAKHELKNNNNKIKNNIMKDLKKMLHPLKQSGLITSVITVIQPNRSSFKLILVGL
jgi:hypothetical protein